MRLRRKSLAEPDDAMELPGLRSDVVELGELSVGHTVHQPGWRWSNDVKPVVGGSWCQAHHVGVALSGRLGVATRDGQEIEIGPLDVYEIPPGHDGWVVGDEPFEAIEWAGARAFLRHDLHDRILVTLLFTDLVDSTATAVRMGEMAWREALSRHYHGARVQLEKFKGREVVTTGDGMLSLFEGPGSAIRCGAAICADARGSGSSVRIGVHVGEVEVVGDNVRGVAVHEAARVMAAAGPGEILVSEMARLLAARTGIRFEDRGTHVLKGIPEPMRLFAYVDEAAAR